jgi:WD40 repeat protein
LIKFQAIGKEIKTFIGHEAKVCSVAFNFDGKILASGSEDKTVKLWSLETSEEICTLKGHSDTILCVAFSPNENILATSGDANDKTIKIWNLDKNKVSTLRGHSDWFGGINSVAFSPDGKTLVSGSKDKTVKLWHIDKEKELSTFTGHSDEVYRAVFNPNAKLIASCNKDNSLKVWRLDTAEKHNIFSAKIEGISSIAFSPDGKTIACGTNNAVISLITINYD